jgi:hypothetical protein
MRSSTSPSRSLGGRPSRTLARPGDLRRTGFSFKPFILLTNSAFSSAPKGVAAAAIYAHPALKSNKTEQ